MREIEFRGKTKDGEWVYGYIDYRDNQFFINEVFETPPTWQDPCGDTHYERHLIDHKTISQYTGLNDKNGVKIFEGDIVAHKDIITCAIEWSKEDYSWSIGRGWPFSDFVYGDLSELEVIGNIYDNPEMVNA